MNDGNTQSPGPLFDPTSIQENLDAMAEFAAGVGHELNNPLAIISGYAQLMLRETDDPKQRQYLSTIIAQTRRAYEMIADIRLFARTPCPQWSLFNLKSLLEECVERLNTWGSGRISFSLVGVPELMEIESDRSQLITVLLSLGRNALEAVMDDGNGLGVITVACPDDEHVLIDVEDNGPGIPDEMSNKVFFPFYSGRQAGRGLGFGLPKAWKLLEGIGGTIRIVDGQRFASGCCWRISLPLRRTDTTDSDQARIGIADNMIETTETTKGDSEAATDGHRVEPTDSEWGDNSPAEGDSEINE
ncbi:MAG: histidine kinase dimerization/phospho-acceptor domain-containing protein [Planctomycetia bacterium]|nr:histidine kinase dimerization/phospho-acceptor domain-containing protein [Planctomycetia bacterium]